MLPRVGDFQQEDTARLAHQCASFSTLRNRRSTCDLICFLKIGYSGLSDQQGHVILTEGIGLCSEEKQSMWPGEASPRMESRLQPKHLFYAFLQMSHKSCLLSFVFLFSQICHWLLFLVTRMSLVVHL